MTTADGKTEKWEIRTLCGYEISQYVRLHMVYGQQRDVQGKRQGFGKLGAHEQRSDQPR